MKPIKLNTRSLGLSKPITILPSVKWQLRSNGLIIAASKSVDKEDVIEAMEANNDYMIKGLNFLAELLKLDEKQVDKLEESIDDQTLGEYLAYVNYRLKGMSEKQYREFIAEAKKAQKASARKNADATSGN